MKTAVIYARYSSDKQTEQSIEGQIRVCNEYAEKNNLKIIDIYVDRAISGKTDNRPAFKKMIEDSSDKNFQFIIVYKLDRFARNRYASAVNKALLKKNGVKLLSAIENITDTPEGIILESLLEGMAEYYSAELAQKVNRGRLESVCKGNSIGGALTYGYKVVDKKYIIDINKAEVVKDIYSKYLSGWLIKDIVIYLKNKGLKFSRSSVTRILSNKKYTGIFKFHDVEYKNYFPQIIEKGIFEKTQEMLNRNRNQSGKYKSKTNYLLSGKLFCGYCNKLIYGESATNSKGNKYFYYKCSTNKKEHGHCECSSLKKDEIENLIISETQKYIFTDKLLDKIVEKIVEVSQKISDSSISNLLNEEKESKQKELNNILKAIKMGTTSKLLLSEVEKLENELEILEVKILKEKKQELPIIDSSSIRNWIVQFKNISIDDEKKKVLFFNSFINKVIIFKDKIRIFYNISDDNKKDISIENLKCLEEDCSSDNRLVGHRGLEPRTH